MRGTLGKVSLTQAPSKLLFRSMLTISSTKSKLYGFNTWSLLQLDLHDQNQLGIRQDVETQGIRLTNKGIYVINMMISTDENDERIFGIQCSPECMSPAVNGLLDCSVPLINKNAYLPYTIVVEEPTCLWLWTSGSKNLNIVNTDNLEHPVLRIIYIP